LDVTERLHGNRTFPLPAKLEADKIQNESQKASWRIFPVKRTRIMAALVLVLPLIATGCGTSDYVQSITLSAASSATSGGFYNLVGIGGTLQLVVNANYHSGKSIPVTDSVTYTVTPQGTDVNTGASLPAPPNTMLLDTTGLLTAVDPAACSWADVGTSTTASWVLTGSYQVVATYKGIPSQPVFIGIASSAGSNAASNNSTLACGPS
jgi:hypothetical protein